MNAFWCQVRLVLLIVLVASRPSFAAPPCGGDCDQGGEVTIDELIKGVGIALANSSIEQCRTMDGNANGEVTVDELVSAVNNALSGCPTFVGAFFGTATLDAGRSATMDVDVQVNGQATATVAISEPTSTRSALFGGAGGAPAISFSIAGTADLDTGAYELSGTFLDDGATHAATVSGVLPLQRSASGPFTFELDTSTFTGSIARGDGATPTATRTVAMSTPTATGTPLAGGPVDPALLGTWSGSARNESTGLVKRVRINIELQGGSVVVTDLGGNLYKTAPASIIMSAPTRTTLIYNVLGNPTITFNLTLGGDQLGGIYSATTIAVPPVPDAVGLVLTKELQLTPDPRLAGTWSGMGNDSTGGQRSVRLKLEIQGDAVVVTDLIGDLFVYVPSSVTARPDGLPTALTYICDTGPCGFPNPVVSLNLSLLGSGRLVGTYYHAVPRGGVSSVSFNLGKEVSG